MIYLKLIEKSCNDLNQTYQDIATKSEVINIISNFKSVGFRNKGDYQKLNFYYGSVIIFIDLVCHFTF